jgi:hypothetical protein
MGKKIQELEAEMVKKSRIKRIINEKIDEVLEKKKEIKDEPSVDNDD